MAILTKSGAYKLYGKILDTGGLTEDMEKDVKRLKDDFDEREGILHKYGEVYDGEDKDDYEWKATEGPTIEAGSGEEWKQKYEMLKNRYINTFLGKDSNPNAEKSDSEAVIDDYAKVKEAQESETKIKTIDELFS